MAFQLVITLSEFLIFILIIEIAEYSDAKSIVVAHRKTTPLFGDGLIEAIPDATIETNVHDPAVDGVGGRAAILSDPVTVAIAASGGGPSNFVGRFGWKCQESTLLAFSGDAYLNEMGITNRYFTADIAPYTSGNQPASEAALVGAEPFGYSLATPDTPTKQLTPSTLQDLPVNLLLPESPTNKNDIARFTDFMELIAPPPPPPLPLSQQAMQGQNLAIARFPDGGGFHAARRMWPAFS